MLLLPLLAVLAVGYGVFALYVEQSVRADLLGTVDDELARVAGVPPQGRNQSQPSDGSAVPIQALLSSDGTEVIDAGNAPPAVLAALADAGLEAGTTTITIDGTDLRVLDPTCAGRRARAVGAGDRFRARLDRRPASKPDPRWRHHLRRAGSVGVGTHEPSDQARDPTRRDRPPRHRRRPRHRHRGGSSARGRPSNWLTISI